MQDVADETIVVDASAIVAALSDAGPSGEWVRRSLFGLSLAAPHLLPVEVASALRSHIADGRLTAESATLAHLGLTGMAFELFPYEPFAGRIWQLRDNLSPYDAWYIALAESLEAPLLTLDFRLARSSGPRCEFRVPPSNDTIQTGME
jgi:predicted nucleic acid-binding protein